MTIKNTNMNLSETVNGMLSDDYKKRFVSEYQQTKIRYQKLKNFCDRIEVAELTGDNSPAHDCPVTLLREQQEWMGLYLGCLEKRAIIENITL